ncbi:TIGR02449 family protein [Endozoicomonas sp. ISHI1]|uniref:TIGR02449 family protein n=2 Tax=Endozoicomonas TaxID=305899 RepID=UPI002147649B|nr:TIGR02449 family protein [Endozoicomonas sp. ISHI1]
MKTRSQRLCENPMVCECIRFIVWANRKGIVLCTYSRYSRSNSTVPEPMNDHELATLNQKIDDLVAISLKLKKENRLLRAKEHTWLAERAKLMEKNDVARSKVEAMINRLRTLEHES